MDKNGHHRNVCLHGYRHDVYIGEAVFFHVFRMCLPLSEPLSACVSSPPAARLQAHLRL